MRRKLLALLLCAGLMSIFLPQVGQAADDYTYIDENGDTKTTGGLMVTPITADMGTLVYGWYVVNSNVTRNDTITVIGSVNLILMDGFTLSVTGSDNDAGIRVSPGNSLTVYGQAAGTGTVMAQGGMRGAAIGSGYNANGGEITINSGTVNATGGQFGAGIGSGERQYDSGAGNGGTINIKGGTVSALGGLNSAGIGGGYNCTGGTINISGGTVNAQGGSNAAGIGGGCFEHGNSITISGGAVNAQGGSGGAGIGGGVEANGGTITLLGDGVIYAQSGTNAYDIGAGQARNGGTLNISGIAAVFMRNDSCIGVTTTHSRRPMTDIADGALFGIPMPSGWTSAAAWIVPRTLTYDANGGTGTFHVTQHIVSVFRIRGGTGVSRPNYSFGGWNTLPNGSGLDIAVGSSFDYPPFVTLYAQWDEIPVSGVGIIGAPPEMAHQDTIALTATVSPTDATYPDVAWTSNDTDVLTVTPAGLVEAVGCGKATITATAGNQSDTCTITVNPSVNGSYDIGKYGNDSVITISSMFEVELTNTSETTFTNMRIVCGTGVMLTLNDVRINNSANTNACPLVFSGSSNRLILNGNSSLKAGNNQPGVKVESGTTLTVNGNGSLSATGGNDGAGIGGGNGISAGSITFTSGTLDAVGSGSGAGIGGGNGGAGGSILASGENTTVSATGGANGYDIGSGNSNPTGGSLSLTNNATVMMNRNGTNASASFITGTVGGDGAGLLAGTYLNSKKLLSISSLIASPVSGAKAFDDVTFTANVTGLSITNPQGQIAFYAGGTEIGRVPLTRVDAGSADATAEIVWSSRGGTHTLTAQYIQTETADSYYVTGGGQTAGYEVAKTEQETLSISGIPGTVTYRDEPFNLSVSGGSSTGSLSYEVSVGDAVSVDANGVVTIEKAGEATIKVTKAADSNYNAIDASINITVSKAFPVVIFPSAESITYKQPLSDSLLTGGSGDGSFAWESPDTVPTVINSGFDVVFTPNDTDNYLPIKQIIALTVAKALQDPLTVSGIPTSLTYGGAPFRLTVGGGSGTGSPSFTVTSGNAVTVDASGKVTIIHGENAIIKIVNSGDDNYLPVSRIISLTVNKAKQTVALAFALPKTIAYGDAPFQIVGSGGNGNGAFGYQVSSGESVAVSATGTVTVLQPGEAFITAVKASDADYLSKEKTIRISVGKGAQKPLILSGIPQRITNGHAPFSLTVSKGSGSGFLSYAVTSGDAVSVSSTGVVTILKPGTAMLSVTKAADDYYDAATATVEINVLQAESEGSVEIPSATPSATVAPGPTATDASAGATESPAPVILKPVSIQTNDPAGMLIVTIHIDDLPEGASSIMLPSGELIQINTAQTTLELSIRREERNEAGALAIIVMDAENIPMGNYRLNLSDDVLQAGLTNSKAGAVSVIAWIVAALVIGVASLALARWLKMKR